MQGPFAHSLRWKTFRISEDDLRVLPVLEPEHKVIRRIPLYQLGEDHLNEIATAIEVFREFSSYPYIHVPKFNVVQAAISPSDIHKPYLFIVDNIEGKPLPSKIFSKKRRQEDLLVLSNFLNSKTEYAKYKYQNGGLYPSDQLPHQYVFGQDSYGNKGIFFVDLHPRFGHVDRNNLGAKTNAEFLDLFVGFIAMRIIDFEERLEMPFSSVRESFYELLSTIESEGVHTEISQDLRQFLENPNLE